MKLAFRVDASLNIGTGHVMRCLTLANALREDGASCVFICREHRGNLLEWIRQSGHEVRGLASVALPRDADDGDCMRSGHDRWLGCDWQTDATETAGIIEKLNPDWLIVDHYGLDVNWESQVKDLCRHLMVIDDLANRRHNCDLLLDQTFGRSAESYTTLVPNDCEILAGSKYALLRPEFAQLREQSLARREHSEVNELLISMGGVDADNITGRVLQALSGSSLDRGVEITVIMGAAAPALEELNTLVHNYPWKAKVKVAVTDMAEIMAQSDIAIGAAGSTSWERCCLGLPTLMLVIASNQMLVARNLEQAGAACVLTLENLAEELPRRLDWLAGSKANLRDMTKASAAVADGRGSMRVGNLIRG